MKIARDEDVTVCSRSSQFAIISMDDCERTGRYTTMQGQTGSMDLHLNACP